VKLRLSERHPQDVPVYRRDLSCREGSGYCSYAAVELSPAFFDRTDDFL
jgi:hypothetical protein